MCFPRVFSGLLCLTALSCRSLDPDLVSIAPQGPRERHMLMSELHALNLRQDSPGWQPRMMLTNRHPFPITVQLTSQDCSCYRTLWNGAEFPVGHRNLLAANSTAELSLLVRPRAQAGRQSWTLRLGLAGPDHSESCDVTTQLVIHPDIAVTPTVLTWDAAAGREWSEPLSVQTTTRERQGTGSNVTITGLPEWLGVARLERTDEQPLPGALWRQTWTLELKSTPSPPGQCLETDCPEDDCVPAGSRDSGSRDSDSLENDSLDSSFQVNDSPHSDPADGGERLATRDHSFHVVSETAEGTRHAQVVGLRVQDDRRLICPQIVDFGEVSLGARRSRRVQLRSGDGTHFRIQTLRTPDAVEVDVSEQESRDRHWLNVHLTPDTLGPFCDTLVVHTTHRRAKHQEIRLRAVVLAPD